MSDVKRGIRPDEDKDRLISPRRYRKVLIGMVLSGSLIAILPLLILSGINYHQYQDTLRAELTRPMIRFAANGKQSLESFLSERLSALSMVLRDTPPEELRDSRNLDDFLVTLNQTFGEIVDLGVIDETGVQIAYSGPFDLEGLDYSAQDWLREVDTQAAYVSDVFMGYRGRPHLAIAVQRANAADRFVLRATIDTDVFHWLVPARPFETEDQASSCRGCHSLGVQPSSDAFIINQAGVLQTSSRLYGGILDPSQLPSLPYSSEAELLELEDANGMPLVVSYAQIEHSPFTLVLASARVASHAGLASLQRDMVAFLVVSIVLILAVVTAGSVYVVNRARESDRQRAALFHKMEYTNKLAAIGRLGAGVAHEINNPLSIITESAGLLKDLLTHSEKPPSREKITSLVDSVLKSAKRCGSITHNLLGFAKQLDVGREPLNLDTLLRELLGFLNKEAGYRNIQVEFDYPEEPPTIVSERGQLQQVFLNLLNNAFAAVEDGGHIKIGIRKLDSDSVAVSIADDGVGIPEEHIERIFDPFFTTKKGAGTGLGLSITYGIVEKLGGEITVQSTVGQGTCFTVTLPIGSES
jgi:two-component system NtrC family sensor kinase